MQCLFSEHSPVSQDFDASEKCFVLGLAAAVQSAISLWPGSVIVVILSLVRVLKNASEVLVAMEAELVQPMPR